MKRFIISADRMTSDSIRLTKQEYHYLARVLRLGVQSQLDIVVEGQAIYRVEVLGIQLKEMCFRVLNQWGIGDDPRVQFTLVQSLPKQDKMTTVLRMCTEIGCGAFVPIQTQYSEFQLGREPQRKIDRWETVLKSAAEQSRQFSVPALHSMQSLNEFCQREWDSDLKLVAWEGSERGLGAVIQELSQVVSSVMVVIGPEGGLDRSEVMQLESCGFQTVSLGDSILRTEHAGFFCLAQVMGLLNSGAF